MALEILSVRERGYMYVVSAVHVRRRWFGLFGPLVRVQKEYVGDFFSYREVFENRKARASEANKIQDAVDAYRTDKCWRQT